MELIPLKNNIYKDVRLIQLKNAIFGRIQELNLTDKKYLQDPEFVLYVMNIAEHLVYKKDGINKKDLLLTIAKDSFGATEEEVQAMSKTIDFLHINKSVKKVSYYKLFKVGLKEWFRKKP